MSISRAGLQAAWADETDGIDTDVLDYAVARANDLTLSGYTDGEDHRRYVEALAVLWARRGGKSIVRQQIAGANPWREEAERLDFEMGSLNRAPAFPGES